jgi:hypothetical protein
MCLLLVLVLVLVSVSERLVILTMVAGVGAGFYVRRSSMMSSRSFNELACLLRYLFLSCCLTCLFYEVFICFVSMVYIFDVFFSFMKQ